MEELTMVNNYGLKEIIDKEFTERMDRDRKVTDYLIPSRILWKTTSDVTKVENEEVLLEKRSGQITLNKNKAFTMENKGENAGILLDFGVEIQGGVQIYVWDCGQEGKARLRVRFGESAMEAMSELGENGSTNDHAIRDQEIELSMLGMSECGNTGFRFVRIDLLGENSFVEFKLIRAALKYKDIEYKGSFHSSDPLLNQIWRTGAYTVHLNMQDYLWDGIKRDRLVWIGDMHPEMSTINAVFGYDEIVPKSMDLIRDDTPLPGWMNGFPSYSMWWVLLQHDWYVQNGDLNYLKEQKDYLIGLLDLFIEYINEENGKNSTPNQFIDWPSSANKVAVDAGVHSLLVMAMDAGANLVRILVDDEHGRKYDKASKLLKKYIPNHGNNKQAAALMALAGLADPKQMNEDVLSVNGADDISTFLGYYVLKARAEDGDIAGCLEVVRKYWGAMLKLGATTFWEHFDLDWMENAARIDEIVPEGKVNVHATYGDYCYEGYRHSLCHGWASGPTAWMSEYILGIKVLEAQCDVVQIKAALGDLDWVEGTYPTPKGTIYVRHERQQDGMIKTKVEAPDGIKIIRENE